SMSPSFAQNPILRVAAAAIIDAEIMGRFYKDFPDAESYDDAARLCGSRNVELVYIATPNRFHAEHASMALESKKHVLIEKPMAIDIAGAEQMIATASATAYCSASTLNTASSRGCCACARWRTAANSAGST